MDDKKNAISDTAKISFAVGIPAIDRENTECDILHTGMSDTGNIYGCNKHWHTRAGFPYPGRQDRI